MRRLALLVLAGLLGAAGGAGAVLAVQEASPGPTTPAAPTTVPNPVETPLPVATTNLLLAWTPGHLPDGLDAVAAAVPGVRFTAVMRGGNLDLLASTDADGQTVDTVADGWAIPIEAVAVDPTALAAVAPAADQATVAALAAGQALLGATSAALRRIGPGGTLTFRTGVVTVAAVVPDEVIGAAEVAVDVATGQQLGFDTPRALLIAHDGDRAALEAALATAIPAGTPVRFRATGETPYLRAADAVLPQSIVKATFGEFAYQPGGDGDRDVTIDPDWVAANIVTESVPVLGEVRCHQAIVAALRGAMEEVEAAGLADAVPVGGYDGCFVSRLVRAGGSFSRHAWGAAFDLNYANNPTSTSSIQDPELVAILQRWGFTWGGEWLVPDPAHFEFVTPPLPGG